MTVAFENPCGNTMTLCHITPKDVSDIYILEPLLNKNLITLKK